MIEALHRILPASAPMITEIYSLTADNVMAALDKQGVLYSVNRLGVCDWDTESSEMTDEQILALIHINTAGHFGKLSICTEACSRYGHEPFSCDANEIGRFVSNYDIEMFFDGDVVILGEESRTLTVYHHSGGYVHVKL